MTVVYIDSVFVLNTLMDYLLCLVTARLAGIPLRRRRYLLAALAGGGYAVAVFLPGCGFLAAAPVKLAVGVCVTLIAYGGEEHLARLTLLLFALSCDLAGCVMALGVLAGSAVPMVNGIFYTDVDTKVLLIAAGSADLVLTVVFRAAARHNIEGEVLTVRICMEGKTIKLAALRDNGNSLREPMGGRPVLVLAYGALDTVLPRPVRQILTRDRLGRPTELLEPLMAAMPGLRPRLLPYHAVGTDSGFLLVIRTDWVEVGGICYQGAPVALAPSALGSGYAALWGGEVRKGGRYGRQHFAMAAEKAGTDTTHSLYRRQRYTSTASEQGAGSGTSQAHGGGERPAGAD